MQAIRRGRPIWLLFLGLILSSNVMLYQTAFGKQMLTPETQGVVIGSLIDLMIMLPILWMLYKGKFVMKQAIILTAMGAILARFLIPSSMLAPYAAVTWIGLGIEALIIGMELFLIVALVRYLPRIRTKVKSSNLSFLFAFPHAVESYRKKKPIIQALCSEVLVFYYAFFTWKKKSESGITLHHKSSYIALQIMLIHSIVIETLVIHFWLHEKSAVISIVLLLLNIYTIVFILADIQATRLNPVRFDRGTMYLSLGLLKRAEIRMDQIESIIEDSATLQSKPTKDTISFVARDFDEVHPHLILRMKEPLRVIMFMGIEKSYTYVAIRSDHPVQLREMLLHEMEHVKSAL
ncbi:beta-carotene 15,15'-monooxygenase [Paenibacillus sp. N1-5-1-14]|uniref:beta-carotene 15,15'-monooxygenase n=1 Tax=Paenibacillus radicibacter TaxID=2972488 RepID=UPI00215928CC|nr:beta-carotene 15,15'-monooxygenase [Paenibacillus radicibacter]MCR8642762.1 beta-carotene 15,15'-monooxygenase [Paenibacillus radicibacter]